MKTKHLEHIKLLLVVISDDDVMWPLIFLHGIRLNMEAHIKCLEKVMLVCTKMVTAERPDICWKDSDPLHTSERTLCWLSENFCIIIIIMSRYQHGYSWSSLSTPPYRPLLSADPQGYSRIGTELLYVGSIWTSCLCSSMWNGPPEYISFELVPTSPAVFRASGSFNFDSFRDG